jgi:hypothetical protein
MLAFIKSKVVLKILIPAGILIILACSTLYYFNEWYYPGYDLAGLDRASYQEALNRVASNFAKSKDMSLIGFDFVQYRETANGTHAFAWASALLRPGEKLAPLLGKRCYVWILITLSGDPGHWRRNEVQLLADPLQDSCYNNANPFQFNSITTAVKMDILEQERRIAEVYNVLHVKKTLYGDGNHLTQLH